VSIEETLAALLEAKLAPLRDEVAALREQLTERPASTARGVELLDVDQVADLCHATAGTVRVWIRSGTLRARRTGRRYLVEMAEVKRFVSGSQTTKGPAAEDEAARILGLVRGGR